MARVAKIPKTVVAIPTPVVVQKESRTLPVIIILVVLLGLAVTIASYFYYQYRQTAAVKDAQEIADLTKEIGKNILLPEGETPTLATVTDKEKLAGQPFFQKAENGDKVLIFSQGGRAILYRPSQKKIVDMTTVNVNQPAPSAPVAVPPTEPTSASQETLNTTSVTTPSIALYNGSTKIGVTNTLEDEIKTQFPNTVVAVKEKAAKTDYEGNTVVDLSGKNADVAKKLADTFGGTIGSLPSGETAPSADILIIVGNKK